MEGAQGGPGGFDTIRRRVMETQWGKMIIVYHRKKERKEVYQSLQETFEMYVLTTTQETEATTMP